MKMWVLYFAVLLVLPQALQAERIFGKGCYRYTDKESLNVAREVALSIAKRQALESSNVFVESTSGVENIALKNDLITSLTAGLLKNLKIIEQSEDLQKREICRIIRADVESIEIKNIVVSKINAFRRTKANIPTGLPENSIWKALKVKEYRYKGDLNLVFTVLCKRKPKSYYGVYSKHLRATWYDLKGIPSRTTKSSESRCAAPGDITSFSIEIPAPSSGHTYTLDLLVK